MDPDNFTVCVTMLCPCGALMQESEGGFFCADGGCPLRTRLFGVSVTVMEIRQPKGAAA
jgi:hypothetical protein